MLNKSKRVGILMAMACGTWAAVGISQTPPVPATQPSADSVMNQLLTKPSSAGQPLAPMTTGVAVDATSGKAAIAPGAPTVQVVREGTHVVQRTGRLSHNADNTQAIFNFESDGRAMKDPPMVILPNLKLMSMEAALVSRSADLRFRVSGTVTEYKGRNYILLDAATVIPDVDQGL